MSQAFHTVWLRITYRQLHDRQIHKWCTQRWPSKVNGPRWGMRWNHEHTAAEFWFESQEAAVEFALTWTSHAD